MFAFLHLPQRPSPTHYDQLSDTSSQSRASPYASPVSTETSAHISPSESVDLHRKPSARRSRNHIPRPRNAFMIFRSEFCAEEKISRSVERDHRHISRIIGYYWNKMSEAEKDIWRLKAEHEKSEHLRKYPGYRFTPTVRTKRPAKRNVKRNGTEDLLRCQLLADLLILGKEGNDLADAARSLETEAQAPSNCIGHPAQEYVSGTDNFVTPSPSSSVDTTIGVRNLPYTNHVLDVLEQNINSGVTTNSISGWQDTSEIYAYNREFSKHFHRPQDHVSDSFVYLRPARERQTIPTYWQQPEIDFFRKEFVDTNSQCFGLNFVDPSIYQYATY